MNTHGISKSLIDLAAGAVATYLSKDQPNVHCRGVEVVVDVTALTGASVVVTIEGKDPTSGKYYTLLASAALTGTGTTVLTVYPGVTVTENTAASRPLPSVWRVKAVNGAGTFSATIGGHLLR